MNNFMSYTYTAMKFPANCNIEVPTHTYCTIIEEFIVIYFCRKNRLIKEDLLKIGIFLLFKFKLKTAFYVTSTLLLLLR